MKLDRYHLLASSKELNSDEKIRIGIGTSRNGEEINSLTTETIPEKYNHSSEELSGIDPVICPSTCPVTQTIEMMSSPNLSLIPFTTADTLVSALRHSRIDAAIRGTLPANPSMEKLRQIYEISQIHRLAFLSVDGKGFALAPVGIDEGQGLEERWSLLREGVNLLQTRMAIRNPRIGVLSLGRVEDRGRSSNVDESLDDGAELVRRAAEAKMQAEHFGILVEKAVLWADLIMAPCGPTGNLIFRTMHHLMHVKAYGAPVMNIDDIFVDTSRAHSDYSNAVALVALLVSKRSALVAREDNCVDLGSKDIEELYKQG